MKSNFFTKMALASFVLALAACSGDDDENNVETQEELVEQIKMSSNMDEVSDDILYIIENQYEDQSTGGRSPQDTNEFLPECATVTSTATGNIWEATIDFGTTGCTMPNGNVLKGVIIISGSTDFSAMSQTIDYSFENFYHNNRHIEGNRHVVRVLENESGNPQSTIELDLTVTFPNGTVVTREGERVWEWIEGVNTMFNPLDNVYLVTGMWITTFPDNSLTTEIGIPLRVEIACQHIVEGTVNFSTNSNGLVLDYGNGACDNQATISINGGEETPISLGN